MDRNTHFINKLYQADAETLSEISRQRMQGKLGPGVDYNESWGAIMVQAYQQGTAAYREHYAAVLAQQLNIMPEQIATIDTEPHGWQHSITALHIAAEIEWPTGTITESVQQQLTQLKHQLPDLAPRERDEQGSGYPHTDYLAALYRLLAEIQPWEPELAEQAWSHCGQKKTDETKYKARTRDETSLTAQEAIAEPSSLWNSLAIEPNRKQPDTIKTNIQQTARAERYWWLAQWAMRSDPSPKPWLSQHLDTFSQALEAADGWPGDMIRFFISVERQGTCSPERLERLIQNIPYPTNRARRQQLATQLYYFDENQVALREECLNHMYNYHEPKRCKRPDILRIVIPQPAKKNKTNKVISPDGFTTPTRHTVDTSSFHNRLARACA